MVKYTIMLWLFCLSLSPLKAQFSGVKYEKHESLYERSTYVVLLGDEAFNEKLKKSIETYWTATKYSFIKMEQVDEYIREEGKNMLLPMVEGSESLDYMYYILIKTGKKSVQSYTYGSWYAYLIVPSVYEFERRMDNIVQAMGNILNIVKEQQLTGGNAKISKNLVQYYNKRSVQLKEGQLYVDKEILHKDFKSNKISFSSIYKYPFTLCDTIAIQDIVTTKEENAYYFVVDGRQTTIYEATSGNIVYCNVELTPIYEVDKAVVIDLMSTILSH